MNALYRPGPMACISTFVRRKNGEEPVAYDHPLMEEELHETYGVTIYQEQIMMLSRRLAGFTRGESDELRKAMGKKVMEVMLELKDKFVAGCLANPDFRIGEWRDETAARSLCAKVWKDWESFASYAFNKSHAVAYAWLAYQTAYLKAHYPEEFMLALMESGNVTKKSLGDRGYGIMLAMRGVFGQQSGLRPEPRLVYASERARGKLPPVDVDGRRDA